MGAPAARGQGAAASPGQCSPSMSVLGFPRPVSSPYLHHTHTGTPMCTHTYILTCMQTQTSTCAHTPLCRAQCCPGSLPGRRRVISLPRLGGEATLLCQPRGISLVIPLSYTQDPDDSSKAAVDGDRVGRTRRSLQQLGQVEPWAGGREV